MLKYDGIYIYIHTCTLRVFKDKLAQLPLIGQIFSFKIIFDAGDSDADTKGRRMAIGKQPVKITFLIIG